MSRSHVSAADAGLTARNVTRREALRLLIGAGICATILPGVARAETTQEKLDAAQLSYEEAQKELDRISAEYEEIAAQLSDTTAQIVDVSDQIDEKQEQIDEKQEQIDTKQQILGQRMSSSYKAGPFSTIDLLLSSATFDELTNNIYYLDKITEADSEMIAEVRELKEQLEQEQAELEAKKADLEDLKARQEDQLADARAKQQESQELVDSLSEEVQELMEKRDAELLAAQRLAEQMRKQQEEEQRRQQEQEQSQGGGSRPSGGSGGGSTTVTGSGSLSRLISACNSTPSPGSGLCAAWVTNVFANAGIGSFWGNADDMYYSWCTTSTANIKPGMIIAVNSSPTSNAGRIYGHIGIYVGSNTVMHNIGYVASYSLSQWIRVYGPLCTPLCGWLGGIALS